MRAAGPSDLRTFHASAHAIGTDTIATTAAMHHDTATAAFPSASPLPSNAHEADSDEGEQEGRALHPSTVPRSGFSR